MPILRSTHSSVSAKPVTKPMRGMSPSALVCGMGMGAMPGLGSAGGVGTVLGGGLVARAVAGGDHVAALVGGQAAVEGLLGAALREAGGRAAHADHVRGASAADLAHGAGVAAVDGVAAAVV